MKANKPLIGITGDFIMVRDIMPATTAYDVYSLAVTGGAEGLPWIIPPLGAELDFEEIMARLDGILFTGARSNIEPHHYHGPQPPENNIIDPARDRTTLPLIPLILERGIPMLCVCRGFQELNVALGGTLHQEVHKVEGKLTHIPPDDASVDDKFAPAHEITIEPGGMLAGLVDERTFKVNSVHGQGIDRLAPRLAVEALAPDGVIEAVRVKDAKDFALGLQFHPEWQFRNHPLYTAIWHAFGDACRRRMQHS